jgi:hypothetical protein
VVGMILNLESGSFRHVKRKNAFYKYGAHVYDGRSKMGGQAKLKTRSVTSAPKNRRSRAHCQEEVEKNG